MMSEVPNRVRRNSTISASTRVPSTSWSFTGEGMKRNASTGTERVQLFPNEAKKPTNKQIPKQPLSPFHVYTSNNKSQPNSPMLNAPRVTNFTGCRPESKGFGHLLFRSKSTDDRNKNAEWFKKCNTYPPSNSKKVAASSSKEKQNNEESEQKVANKTIDEEFEEKSFGFPSPDATTPMMTPSRMWGRSDSSGQKPELFR
uniref:Uncharacterized protein n=1 Tax=Globodera rostochiensis TaxID=31243 RepID=A0A914H6J9_GLORO